MATPPWSCGPGARSSARTSKTSNDAGLPVPPSVAPVQERGTNYVSVLEGGGTEPLDRGNADDMCAYYAKWVDAVNATRGVQADEAARRARHAADELREVQAKLDAMVPILRDTQRSKSSARATRTACSPPPTRSPTCSTPRWPRRARSTSRSSSPPRCASSWARAPARG